MTEESATSVNVSDVNLSLYRLQLGLAIGVTVFLLALGFGAYGIAINRGLGSQLIWVLLVFVVVASAALWRVFRRLKAPLMEIRVVDSRVGLVFRDGHTEEFPLTGPDSSSAIRVVVRPPWMSAVSPKEKTYWLTDRGGRPSHMLTSEALEMLTTRATALRLTRVTVPAPEQGSPNSELVVFVEPTH